MEEKFGHKSKNRYDLNPDEEVLLCQWAKEEHDSDFVFVTHFPSAKRPFYAKDDPEDPKLALSFDLLFRGLEITTGGQRIHDYQEQMDKLAARKMNAELFESFTMLHKYGIAARRSGHRSGTPDHAAAGAEQHPRGFYVPA